MSKAFVIWSISFIATILLEPYNYFGRRGRKEPEALAAASLKRLYVENRPHLVGGFSHHDPSGSNASSIQLSGSEYSVDLQNMKISIHSVSGTILSMAEKYRYMRETFRKRLAFGKTCVHLRNFKNFIFFLWKYIKKSSIYRLEGIEMSYGLTSITRVKKLFLFILGLILWSLG